MARAKPPVVLTDKHYRQLKAFQKNFTQTLEFLQRCTRCKIDVQEEMQATQDQIEVVKALIKEFFPNQPQL